MIYFSKIFFYLRRVIMLEPLPQHPQQPPTITSQVARLPDLCQHKIYKYLHKMYMVDLCREIEHNVVWVRLRSGNNYRYEFLTSTQKNYPIWEDSD